MIRDRMEQQSHRAHIETTKLQDLTHHFFELTVPMLAAEHDKLDHGAGPILFAMPLF